MQAEVSEVEIDGAVNDLCASAAKDILAQAGLGIDVTDRQTQELAFAAVTIETRRLARTGKIGAWCFFCGTDDVKGWCTCPFPADFRCHGKFVCESCRAAHQTITEHIEQMVSFPAVERADSRRSRFEIELFRAAKRVCNPNDSDDYDHAEHRDLAFHLAQADPFGDSDVFRATVLRAFRVSKFMAYQQLAAQLAAIKQQAIIRAVSKAIRAAARRRHDNQSGAIHYR